MATGGARYHSARRLLRALSILQEEASNKLDDRATFLDVVAATAGMDPANPAVLGMSEAILELPHRVARDVRVLDGDQARYALRGVSALLDTLNPRSLLTTWSDLYRDIDATGMPGLTICSMLLDAQGGEKELDEDELDRIAEDAKKLLEEVRLNDSMPVDVLEFVESALVSLLKAIDEYWLKGSVAVEQAVDNTIGRAVRERRFEKADGGVRHVLKRLGIILSRLAIVVAVANDLDSLPATVHDVVHEIVEITDLGRSDVPIQPEPPGSLPNEGTTQADGG